MQLAIRNDEELNKLLSGVTIAQGGVETTPVFYCLSLCSATCPIAGFVVLIFLLNAILRTLRQVY